MFDSLVDAVRARSDDARDAPAFICGYFENPEETARTFDAVLDGTNGWLRTGDLGFALEGELFITDRLKDLVIIRGQNHAPSLIEEEAQAAHPSIHPGGVVAFTVEGPDDTRLVVIAEVSPDQSRIDPREVETAIVGHVSDRLDLGVDDVILVRPQGVPRTTSGKVQRHRCRDLYLSNRLKRAGLRPHLVL